MILGAAGLLGVLTISRLEPWFLDAQGRGLPASVTAVPSQSPVQLIESSIGEPFVLAGPPPSQAVAPPREIAGLAPDPLPTPVSDFRATLYAQVPLVHDPLLASRVVDRLSGRSGKFGVAIKDLASGRGVVIDPDGEYEAASLFKLWVMYEVFKQRELGHVSFGEVLVFNERHVAYDLGTLDRPAGSTIPLTEALERMITISDNSSAILLTDRVGALSINRDLRALGMLHSRLSLDNLVTSPGDLLAFLEMLAQGSGVNERASAEMLNLLARQRVNDRIPRLLPPGTTVAHKTGNLPGVVNDAGIVYGPEASFIIAVLANNTRDEAEAARATSDLAALTYEYLRATGSTGPASSLPMVEPSPTRPPVPPSPIPTETAMPPREEVSRTVPAEATGSSAVPPPGAGGAKALTPAVLQKPGAIRTPSPVLSPGGPSSPPR